MSRLACTAKWLLAPGFGLLIGIGMIANRRFYREETMNGTWTWASRSLEINLRYNQDTLNGSRAFGFGASITSSSRIFGLSRRQIDGREKRVSDGFPVRSDYRFISNRKFPK
jgi:hypothetical protein